MIGNQTTDRVRDVLSELPDGDFSKTAEKLLGSLGYRGDDALPSETITVGDFIADHPALNPGTKSEQEFVENTRSVRIISQISDAEITANAQQALIDASAFDTGNARSFLFLTVELKEDTYTRGQYAAFTREINKRWQFPTVVLFKTAANLLTLAFAHRRLHRRDPGRDVLGNVFLIREIDAVKPHRAHLDILDDLSLPKRLGWISAHGKPHNFDGLLEAWLDALDTEELNRRFYRDLFNWFERAVAQAKFPKTGPKVLKPEEHVIRLITRLLFVWFIKEKGLVAEDLFVENRVGTLLQDYDRADGDSYYRAVLQNLFFATLNTEIDRRGFSNGNKLTGADSTGDFSLYRYREEMNAPDAMLELFGHTPFINGGLFDCLDSEGENGDDGWRIDCFTDDVTAPGHGEYGILSIPNGLFFDEDNQNPGLITLFNRYKFTVEENTPAEQEVALDPELLGKVFENLLAANIPETSETVRKQTGSYYTPRPVVDYMVNEALVAVLVQKAQGDDGDGEPWQAKLRDLLDYDDAFNDVDDLFSPSEKAAVVRAIANTRTLDPAVGSGAFPMSILHHLTLALRRLDPDNRLWAELQKERALEESGTAYEAATQQERDERLAEISETFERYRDSDFGRKLYLIQNSIYGVDIQTIAIQIAKLRFFISLAIEQKPSDDKPNFGVKPLPNLETRFVAADTLLPLHDLQTTLTSLRVQELQRELYANGERHFHANTRDQKLECNRRDDELRVLLAAELKQLGMPSGDAEKYANWKRYDQNTGADWFDAGYMFGVNDGFDVVISNPPYRQVRKGTYPAARFPYSEGRDKGKQNLYKLFVEQSYNLCKTDGLATLIVQSSLMCDLSSAATRQLLLDRTRLRHVIEFPKAASTREAQLFQSVTQGTCIYQFTKKPPNDKPIGISVGNDAHTIADLRFASITKATIATLYPDLRCFPRIRAGSVAILEKIAGDKTIKPLQYYAANTVQGDLNLTTHAKRFSQNPTAVRLLRGRHIGRFIIKYATSSEYCEKGFMAQQVNANRQGQFLISQQITGTNDIRRLHFGLAEDPPVDFLCGNSVNKTQLKDQTQSKAFLALLNSRFMDWFFRITSTNNHVQGYELEQLPVPAMTAERRHQLVRMVDEILEAKAADPDADTSEIEEEIDWLVYDLYGLTNAEVAVVEGEKGEVHATVEEEDTALSRAMDEVLGEEHVSRDELMAVLQAPDEG